MIQEIIALIVQALISKRKIAENDWAQYDNLSTQLLGATTADLSRMDADAIIARYQDNPDKWELCELAARGGGTSISSMCTVFAESEVISLIGRGEKRENIAFAVVDSIVKKVVSQASKIHHAGARICLTGGLCDFEYLRQSLSRQLGAEVITQPDARYAGAIGAAVTAMNGKK